MTKTLIKNALLVTMDPATEDLRSGDILLVDDRIAQLAPEIHVDDAEVVDASGMVASPGFVDTHRHVWQSLLRGVAVDWSLFQYMVEMRTMYPVCYGVEEAYLGNHYGAWEALNAGVTTVVDHSHLQISEQHSDALVEGLKDAGIRGIFGYGVYRNPRYVPGEQIDPSALIVEIAGPIETFHRRNAERVREKYFPANDGLLRFGIASSEFFTFPSMEPILEELAWSRTLEPARITFHAAIGINGDVDIINDLSAAGALGDDLLMSHANCLTDEDLATIAREGGWISTTPDTELQMSGTFPVLERVVRSGRMPSLGVDIVSGFAGDMFTQMRLMLQAMRFRHNEATVPGGLPSSVKYAAADMLKYATLGGATCVGLQDEIGSITVGKKADVVLTRLDSVNTAALRDPVAALVFFANASDVEDVWVGGVARKRGGELQGVSWGSLRDRVQSARTKIDDRFARIDATAMRRAWEPVWGIAEDASLR
ncbi:amidohydrolase family protein [Microbacterium sp. No. 7]|uniref:amidohydrolase family protein n=1 Tax=Microbacterium sp. No. 7 TaxID=1714373 RepID=UPI0006ECD5B0|nr:amidohydrolase family protein [Microbacterium sp. No. 7]ALJ18616.1 cytosine deaminase [Microbacterium sp. No. 7]